MVSFIGEKLHKCVTSDTVSPIFTLPLGTECLRCCNGALISLTFDDWCSNLHHVVLANQLPPFLLPSTIRNLQIEEMKILFIGLLPVAVAAAATPPHYSVIKKVDTNEGTEYRFKKNSFHFMSLIYKDGQFILRPNPSGGKNDKGLGTSLYAQPFLPQGVLKDAFVESPYGNAQGIHTKASGKVSRGDLDTYGNWSSDFVFTYDRVNEKIIKGHGKYKITLDDKLSEDLNLFKISSKYLDNVPLVSGETGDTGDMKKVMYNGVAWIPDGQYPEYYPTGETDRLSIDVKGQCNQADGVSPALKPNFKVIIEFIESNTDDGTRISFGAKYVADQNVFSPDNVGITPLIAKTSTQTDFKFDMDFESTVPDMSCPSS